jgi:hypothetical protein
MQPCHFGSKFLCGEVLDKKLKENKIRVLLKPTLLPSPKESFTELG